MNLFRHPSHSAGMSGGTVEFVRLFGPPIDLWICENGVWQHPVDAVLQDWPPEVLEVGVIPPESLQRYSAAVPAPHVEELAEGIFLIGTVLVIPPTEGAPESSTVMAWGTVQTTAQKLISTSLRLSNEQNLLRREVAESRMGNIPHLEQISANFEELNWLRRLGGEVGICDAANPLIEMGHRVLPDLGDLIKAEALLFVDAVPVNPLMEGTATRAGRPLVWVGPRLLEDQDCVRLIDMLREDVPFDQPILQNHMDSLGCHHEFPRVHSVMVIPVIHHDRCFGWLVALNRIVWEPLPGALNDSAPAGLCENEFGTGDASLMSSAAALLASQARNSELFQEKEALLIGIIRALINTLDARDSYTCGHSDRVAIMAKCIGEEIGLDSRECERLYMTGLLHDVGKIGIPDHVLLKPGKLTDEEFEIIRQHPKIGYGILNNLPQMHAILPGVLHHHESVNGRGYPAGLCDEQIPLAGRILAVADAYDAMTSCRPYRTAMPVEKALAILQDGAGTQWDARIVEAFLKARPAIQIATRELGQSLQQPRQPTNEGHSSPFAAAADSISRAVMAGMSNMPTAVPAR